MVERPVTALALAVLVGLAGCGGSVVGDSGRAETATLTPAPLPGSPTPAGSTDELAPGLVDRGVTDPGRLVDAHAAVLARTSYVTAQTVERRSSNGTVLSRYETVVQLSADKRRSHYTLQVDGLTGTDRRVERFADGSRVYEAVTAENGTRYRLVRTAAGEPRDPSSLYPTNRSNRRSLLRLLTLLDTTVTDRRQVGGSTRYRVAVEGETADLPPIRNISFTAVVDESGLVRQYRVGYDVRRGDRRVHVTVRTTYTGVGETTVERPPWVDEAAATARTTSTGGELEPTPGRE